MKTLVPPVPGGTAKRLTRLLFVRAAGAAAGLLGCGELSRRRRGILQRWPTGLRHR